jgi:hypothetical protein
MFDPPLTKHAESRLQQRGIPRLMVELLLRYGKEQRTHEGTVVFLDARGRDKVRDALQEILERLDKLGDTYLIEADDTSSVVTVGHRTKRLRRR